MSVTDRRGNVQSFTYNAGGRITKVTNKNGNETAYTYDSNGNITCHHRSNTEFLYTTIY